MDRRADIWSFGVVLFEMLTGTRAFEGEDIADTLGNVMKVEPNWQRVPASIPPRVVQVLRACLQKNPKQRMDSAQGVRLALDGGTDGQLLPTGHLVYVRQATVFAMPFDESRLTATGGAVPVQQGVRQAPTPAFRRWRTGRIFSRAQRAPA